MPEHSADQPPSTSLAQLEGAYEEWFQQHAAAQPPAKPSSRGRNWWRGLASLRFFPRTGMRKFAFHPASIDHSLATDWALVGADLYAAVQECKKK